MSLSIDNKEYLFVEKYRPKSINSIIIPEELKDQMREWVKDEQIPNLLLSGRVPGTGKSSMCHTIITETGADALFLNASLYPNIDILRSKIQGFVSTSSFDGNPKIVVLDEADFLNCLEENEEIELSDGSFIKLKDMIQGREYSVISFNQKTLKFEEDLAYCLDSKLDDIYEIELENGKSIRVNYRHPIMVRTASGNIETRTIEEGFTDVEIILR